MPAVAHTLSLRNEQPEDRMQQAELYCVLLSNVVYRVFLYIEASLLCVGPLPRATETPLQ